MRRSSARPRPTRRSSPSTATAALEARDGVARRVLTGKDRRARGRPAHGVGAARRGDQDAPSTGRWPRTAVKHVGDAVAVVVGDRPLRRRRRGRGRARRVRPAAGRSSTSRRRSRRARRSSTRTSGRTRSTNGRSAAATSRPASPRPTWWSSGGSSTTAPRARAIEPRAVVADYRAGDADDVSPRRRSRTSCACSWPLMLGMSEERSASSPRRSAAASAPSCRSTARSR